MNTFYKYFILLLASIPNLLFAQNPIPNPSFENWSGGAPDGWYVNNIPGISPCTQSNDSHSGSSALKGEVLNVAGNPFIPVFWAGTQTDQFIVTTVRHAQLTGYYKFSSAAEDSFVIGVSIFDTAKLGFGGGVIALPTVSSFTKFTIDIVYADQKTPAFANITGSLHGANSQNPAFGSVFIIDDLEFAGTVTSVLGNPHQNPTQFELQQNYPNPFNPETVIHYHTPQSGRVELAIFNLLGQKVRVLVNDVQPAGSYEVHWQGSDDHGNRLSSGTYLYLLRSGGLIRTKRMTFLQ